MRSLTRASRARTTAALSNCRIFVATANNQSTGRGDLFHFMGLQSSPVLAVPQLQKKYHEMQWKCHPDQQQQQPIAPSAHSTDDSVYANIAYETLKDPFLRCKYLLKLILTERRLRRPLTLQEAEQVHLDDHDEQLLKGTSSSSAGEPLLAPYVVPEEFLSRMMELNEEVFELDVSEAQGQERMRALQEEVKRLDSEFFSDAAAAWETQDHLRLKETVLQWTYIANLKKHIVNRLP